MPKVTIVGIFFVHIALILYTLFIIYESKKQKTTKSVLVLITLAVIFDLVATTCMMIGTTRTYFTFHGIMGYIGLLLMMVDAVLLWKYKLKFGIENAISKSLNSFSKIAYTWWIIAYITGVLVSIFRR
jgi:EamA domain-containing membrane protein RarD